LPTSAASGLCPDCRELIKFEKKAAIRKAEIDAEASWIADHGAPTQKNLRELRQHIAAARKAAEKASR
jgi:hypothetical protein